jgi:hypothetical protein
MLVHSGVPKGLAKMDMMAKRGRPVGQAVPEDITCGSDVCSIARGGRDGRGWPIYLII